MIRKVFTTALLAGFLAGLIISLVQEFTTTPLILHAEEYENAGPEKAALSLPAQTAEARIYLAHAGGPADHQEREWAPADGIERSLYTSGANVIAGIGFSLLLVAAFTLHGRPVNGRTGLLWGIAGFTVFSLAPALGLAPEAPGAIAAELSLRQGWWVLTAACTAAGLWLLFFRQQRGLNILGLVIIALPHIIGAPHPTEMGGNTPPELAAAFAAASLVVSAVFWALMGWLNGMLFARFGGNEALRA